MEEIAAKIKVVKVVLEQRRDLEEQDRKDRLLHEK